MPRPLTATIDIDAMRANLALARSRAPGQRTWAVVKADAYGHGLTNALKGFQQADGMALVEFDKAARLRELGWRKPVLMLEGAFDQSDVELAAELDLSLVVHNEEQLRMIELAAARPGAAYRFRLVLKLNTGMNRLGFRPAALRPAWERLRALPQVQSLAFVTHFANADDDQNGTASRLPASVQAERFQQAVQGLDGDSSLANSAAAFWLQPLPGDWARPGVMLYGGSPGSGAGTELGLAPAMILKSRIIAVQDVAAGEAVGYGSRFVAQRSTRIGIVACGYADGYPRSAPDGTPVLVDGVRTGIAGRVSMDMLTVDLGPVPQAGVGSEVVLWGQDVSIDEVAQAAGTIGYELMCALAPRVQVQVRGG